MMKDSIMTGASVMIKIDGTKVKQLRESQGLTQLYLATTVEVTTDTISRWENKRYPSIKKENGLKLAEALGVCLDEILEHEDKVTNVESAPHRSVNLTKRTFSYKKGIILSLFIILAASFFGYTLINKKTTPLVMAHRIMPAITIAAVPFPVVVEVNGQENTAISLILKENIPDNASIISTSPKVAISTEKGEDLKWIQKINGRTVFAYMIKIDSGSNTVSDFSGSVAVSQENAAPIAVQGDSRIRLGPHHWADSDGDNVISDHEILTVYDQYSGIEGFDIDIDLIERMWLGSRYKWDQNSKSFTILP